MAWNPSPRPPRSSKLVEERGKIYLISRSENVRRDRRSMRLKSKSLNRVDFSLSWSVRECFEHNLPSDDELGKPLKLSLRRACVIVGSVKISVDNAACRQWPTRQCSPYARNPATIRTGCLFDHRWCSAVDVAAVDNAASSPFDNRSNGDSWVVRRSAPVHRQRRLVMDDSSRQELSTVADEVGLLCARDASTTVPCATSIADRARRSTSRVSTVPRRHPSTSVRTAALRRSTIGSGAFAKQPSHKRLLSTTRSSSMTDKVRRERRFDPAHCVPRQSSFDRVDRGRRCRWFQIVARRRAIAQRSYVGRLMAAVHRQRGLVIYDRCRLHDCRRWPTWPDLLCTRGCPTIRTVRVVGRRSCAVSEADGVDNFALSFFDDQSSSVASIDDQRRCIGNKASSCTTGVDNYRRPWPAKSISLCVRDAPTIRVVCLVDRRWYAAVDLEVGNAVSSTVSTMSRGRSSMTDRTATMRASTISSGASESGPITHYSCRQLSSSMGVFVFR